MAFLSISLTLTIETSVPSPTTAQPPRQQRNNTYRPTAPHTAPSSSSQSTDTLAAFLSAPTQALQHLTRARMYAQREEEANDDAGSLEVLEAAEARRGRVGRAREAALDRESLWVLEREVGKLEVRRRGASKGDDVRQGSKSSSGWTSSFEKVEVTPGEVEAGDRTPDPSPTQASSLPPGEQQQRVEEDPFASPSHGLESDFVRSLVESRRRREEGGVWGDGDDGEGGEPPEGVKAGVAELMRRFEELGEREKVGVEGDA